MNISSRAKFRIVLYILVIGIALIGIIILSARISQVQFDINSINKQILEAERKNQSLIVDIKTATNITNLEERAYGLGLRYPDFDETVTIGADREVIEDLALALMEKVYN